jgi:hypothetical protein
MEVEMAELIPSSPRQFHRRLGSQETTSNRKLYSMDHIENLFKFFSHLTLQYLVTINWQLLVIRKKKKGKKGGVAVFGIATSQPTALKAQMD